MHAAKRGKEKPVEEVTEPKKCVTIADCSKVSCGAEFTMFLCKGKLYAAGNPQNGQLGDGSDHSLNVKDSSIKIMHEPQGVPIMVPHIPDDVMNVACGVNHTVCITNEGECFTWGSGNYGRLGHKVQQVRPSCGRSTWRCTHAGFFSPPRRHLLPATVLPAAVFFVCNSRCRSCLAARYRGGGQPP